jgi:Fe-Mn family superoxide dismutase
VPFELAALPFAKDALEPHMSAETLGFHHDKHHAKYVNTLNELLSKSGEEPESLEALICESEGKVFNNAAQAYNHEFFWNCLSPQGGGEPPEALAKALTDSFGSVDKFREAFTTAAATHFGSGWAWLVRTKAGKLEVTSTHDADCPLRAGSTPLLTCDVWEHAYYVDYRNDRGAYVEAFWKMVDWKKVAARL